MRLKKLLINISRRNFTLSTKLKDFLKTRTDQLFRIPKYEKEKDLFADVKQFDSNVKEMFNSKLDTIDNLDISNR